MVRTKRRPLLLCVTSSSCAVCICATYQLVTTLLLVTSWGNLRQLAIFHADNGSWGAQTRREANHRSVPLIHDHTQVRPPGRPPGERTLTQSADPTTRGIKAIPGRANEHAPSRHRTATRRQVVPRVTILEPTRGHRTAAGGQVIPDALVAHPAGTHVASLVETIDLATDRELLTRRVGTISVAIPPAAHAPRPRSFPWCRRGVLVGWREHILDRESHRPHDACGITHVDTQPLILSGQEPRV